MLTLVSLWQPDVNTSYPCFVIETVDNPLQCRYRCIDGKHRIHRLLASGARTIPCHVLTLEEVGPYVIGVPPKDRSYCCCCFAVGSSELMRTMAWHHAGIPLCLLPPLPPVGSGDLAEEEDVRGSNAKGACLYMQRLGIDVVAPTHTK